ncbi:capsular polysaccharide synthesis protein [Levilactobacillus namurensis]|uniref:capsular polysaccharide synthesis protein n=1 Tax=Levilactobacillus namurensis TaxID=380393 RepID=UPI002230D1D9|nr:capsular polysaccharide synthesis protein [Levilactobacillus namurensis]MCW3779559.1 capsular polysaccharide synthesis protein [Levilactobacillus namurensis]MDT7018147.1 capsular polysaccharide synthesis protein [Levilactobacillus namurensis]WNN64864.1 capsular polysaccharide synthesis protein [Levilactobacillus namurensis]
MKKVSIIIKCFGIVKGIKYISIKLIGLFLRMIFRLLGSKMDGFASVLKRVASKTDEMIEDYIYEKYKPIFYKYSKYREEGVVPSQKILWTVWLQGEANLPYAVSECIKSMKRNAGEYTVQVVSLENLNRYLDVDSSVIESFNEGHISAAHLSDYLRVMLLKRYGGVWLDATQYMVRPLPDDIWNFELLVWNKVRDITSRNMYVAIPFVEKFNNGFLVGKRNSLFYSFAADITFELLSDPILKIDYFSNFKAYFAGVKRIPELKKQWSRMEPVNQYGLLTRQLWNKPITQNVANLIDKDENIFFVFTYKLVWKNSVNGVKTVQEYILESYQ